MWSLLRCLSVNVFKTDCNLVNLSRTAFPRSCSCQDDCSIYHACAVFITHAQYLSRMRSIYHACAILAWNLAQGHTSWVTPMAIARLSPKFWKTLTALDRKIWSSVRTWSREGKGDQGPPWFLKCQQKRLFSLLRMEKRIFTTFDNP